MPCLGAYSRLIRGMPTISTKIPEREAREIAGAAKKRRKSVAAFVREAALNEATGGTKKTFGQRFGHLIGAAHDLPAKLSAKEGYAD